MDMSKQELSALQVALVEVLEIKRELSDLELTLVGGGCGEVVFG